VKLVYVEDGLTDATRVTPSNRKSVMTEFGRRTRKESEVRKATDQRQGEVIGEVLTVSERVEVPTREATRNKRRGETAATLRRSK